MYSTQATPRKSSPELNPLQNLGNFNKKKCNIKTTIRIVISSSIHYHNIINTARPRPSQNTLTDEQCDPQTFLNNIITARSQKATGLRM